MMTEGDYCRECGTHVLGAGSECLCDVCADEHPPSCDMTAEDKKPPLKECFNCGGSAEIFSSNDYAECDHCGVFGPDPDPHGHKWNSIPRRSEVLELIRLVDNLGQSPHIMGATYWDSLQALFKYADKLRKEVGG